jgi:hypothetical protein
MKPASESQRPRWTSANERRKTSRLKTFTLTCLRFKGKQCRAHVLNISQAGAHLVTTEGFRRGDQIWLGEEAGPEMATVVWVAGAKLGVRFVTPLTDQQLAEWLAKA